MIDCKYLKGDVCLVATSLAGVAADAKTTEEACWRCIANSISRAPNHVTGSLAIACAALQSKEQGVAVLERLKPLLNKPERILVENLGYGVGWELHSAIERGGYKVTNGCGCVALMARMNVGGRRWCLDSRDLIVDSVYAEFVRRQPVLSKFVPKVLAKSQAADWLDESVAAYDSKMESVAALMVQ